MLVDDHFMIRVGLATSLNAELDMQVIAEAANAEQALAATEKHRPNLALVDVRLPGLDGIDATAKLLHSNPEMRVLILSAHVNEEDASRAVQAGAHGYILKTAPRKELLHAIREVFSGRQYFDASTTRALHSRLSRPKLSKRELEILKLLATGMSNREIADKLFVVESTIKMHVSNILEKLQVDDRTEAVGVAIQTGIIALE